MPDHGSRTRFQKIEKMRVFRMLTFSKSRSGDLRVRLEGGGEWGSGWGHLWRVILMIVDAVEVAGCVNAKTE